MTPQRTPFPAEIWRHKKTGDEVKITFRPGPFGVKYRRHPLSSNSRLNRERAKLIFYFQDEYEFITPA